MTELPASKSDFGRCERHVETADFSGAWSYWGAVGTEVGFTVVHEARASV